MGIGGELLVSRKNIVVSKDSIGIDKDLTKDQNLNTFKMYCKRRKSSARFPYRKARNRLYACHCIAGNEETQIGPFVDCDGSPLCLSLRIEHCFSEDFHQQEARRKSIERPPF